MRYETKAKSTIGDESTATERLTMQSSFAHVRYWETLQRLSKSRQILFMAFYDRKSEENEHWLKRALLLSS